MPVCNWQPAPGPSAGRPITVVPLKGSPTSTRRDGGAPIGRPGRARPRRAASAPPPPRGTPERFRGGACGSPACRPCCGTPRATGRVPARGLGGGTGWGGPRRPGGALPLASGGLGPRHRGWPQPGRRVLARGALRLYIRPRVGGGALAARRGLARPGRPMGASPSHPALVWLPFSGTTVMGLPPTGRMPGDLTRAPLTIDSLEPLRLRIEEKREINFQ